MTAEKFVMEFESFQGAELKSFLLRMTASVQDAEDIVQETYHQGPCKVEHLSRRVIFEDMGLYVLHPTLQRFTALQKKMA
jgi:hypothetical protein